MYSQVGQDEWVISLFGEGYKGFFLDLGCQMPKRINNTLLLEEKGWDGVSYDIVDYSKDWEIRKTRFVCANVFTCDFAEQNLPKVIDYLSLDISPYAGCRFHALKRLFNLGYEFKTITIEHNYYMNNVPDQYEDHDISERQPQRRLLLENGYLIVRADVGDYNLPFEDWWVNTKYFDVNAKLKV